MAVDSVMPVCAGGGDTLCLTGDGVRPAGYQYPAACRPRPLRQLRGGLRFTLREGVWQLPHREDLPGGAAARPRRVDTLSHLRRLPIELQRRVLALGKLTRRRPNPMFESLGRQPCFLGGSPACRHEHCRLSSSRCKARWPRLPHIARVAPRWGAGPARNRCPAGWRHGDHDNIARRLSLSRGQTDREGLRDRSLRLPFRGGRACAPRGWPRSGQREPATLSLVWLLDETHRGHHRPRR
jgi:hypothetical protein